MQETTDAAQSSEDNAALLQAATTNTVDRRRLTDVGDVTHNSHSSLSAPVPVTCRRQDVADGDTLGQSSVVAGINSDVSRRYKDNSGAEAVSSAQSSSTVTASADNVVSSVLPADSLSTQVLKPSSDVDDIFADSSLFVTCK